MAQYVCCYVPCTYIPVPVQQQSHGYQPLAIDVQNGIVSQCPYVQSPATPTSNASTVSNTFHVHNPYSMTCIEEYKSTGSVTTESVDTEDCDVDESVRDSYECSEQDCDDRRNKRRRKKRAVPEDNNEALDALRYKTKMCKNFEITGKCPYGPRCLFAHGKRELRTYSENNQAIFTAARTESPERQFFAIGRFPKFIPYPTELMEVAARTAA